MLSVSLNKTFPSFSSSGFFFIVRLIMTRTGCILWQPTTPILVIFKQGSGHKRDGKKISNSSETIDNLLFEHSARH